MRLVWGTVVGVPEDLPDVQRLRVMLDPPEPPEERAAVAFPRLTGRCSKAERVLLNTTAVELGLGTGGEDFVVARAGHGVALDVPPSGHIMKLRYTPLQHDVVAVEEPAGAHSVMTEARTLDGMPVVCCGLHSQMPVVAAAARERAGDIRIAYVMTDAASLPIAVSRLVPRAVEAGLIDTTITCGQAFGGMYEAVNVYSALLAARHVIGADMAIVAIGPGIPGTATPFGHGGVAQGEALNAAAALAGVPVAVLRLSFADTRARHVPVSHQTLTALCDVALRPVTVAVPVLGDERDRAIIRRLEDSGVSHCHDLKTVRVGMPEMRGVEVKTMGRGWDDDPAFFLAAAAGGSLAAERHAR